MPRRGPKLLLHLLLHSGKLLQEMVSEQLLPLGVHHGQGRVLSVLERFGPLTQAELARGMGLAPATVTVMLRPMEEQGGIERSVDPISGRARVVALTRDGAARAAQVHTAWRRVERSIRKALPGPAYDEAFSLLESLRDGLGGRTPEFQTYAQE